MLALGAGLSSVIGFVFTCEPGICTAATLLVILTILAVVTVMAAAHARLMLAAMRVGVSKFRLR